MIDVSIIIPTYNRLWCLPKAVNSCTETNLSIEIIVIDDGSNDGTAAWLSDQPGIKVISQDNQGKAWAVNKGFAIARGKYIRFLDSDDWLLPRSTDELFYHAEKYGLDIACAGYQVFEGEKFIREIRWTVCDDFLAQQLGECDSSHYAAYLFKKEFISDIPHRQEYGSRDDRQFIIEAALKNPKTGYIDTPTLAHRVHNNEKLQLGTGLNDVMNNRAILMIYKKCFAILTKEGRLQQRYKNAATPLLWHLAHWIARTHLKEAKEVYKWVYQLNPKFKPDNNGMIATMYKYLGFELSERIFRTRRSVTGIFN